MLGPLAEGELGLDGRWAVEKAGFPAGAQQRRTQACPRHGPGCRGGFASWHRGRAECREPGEFRARCRAHEAGFRGLADSMPKDKEPTEEVGRMVARPELTR